MPYTTDWTPCPDMCVKKCPDCYCGETEYRVYETSHYKPRIGILHRCSNCGRCWWNDAVVADGAEAIKSSEDSGKEGK